MNDKEIFDLAETYGEWDAYILGFEAGKEVRTHTSEDVKKIQNG